MPRGVYERTDNMLTSLKTKRGTPEYRARIAAGMRRLNQERPREAHPRWKGGRWLRADGYVSLNLGAGKTKLEHRAVMEQILGRPLEATEYVHHRNGIRSDNRRENLALRGAYHGKGATLHCPTCTCTQEES